MIRHHKLGIRCEERNKSVKSTRLHWFDPRADTCEKKKTESIMAWMIVIPGLYALLFCTINVISAQIAFIFLWKA